MTRDQVTIFIILPFIGYLLGSIPFAWVIGRAKGIDIRTVGSKNIGATNLGRTLGPQFFWYAFLLDAAKGFLPVLAATLFMAHVNGAIAETWAATATPQNASAFELLSSYLTPVPTPPFLEPYWAPLITGCACVLGHLFPVWLKFKGGKGVATAFGVVLGFWPLFTLSGLIAGAFFVFMLMVYRYISLASMSASVVFVLCVATLGLSTRLPFFFYMSWHARFPLVLIAALFAAAIIFRHRANIGRLIKGTEPQIGKREMDKARLK